MVMLDGLSQYRKLIAQFYLTRMGIQLILFFLLQNRLLNL